MPRLPCPNCTAETPRRLDIESHVVNYYRCPVCGHVWTVQKDTGTLHNVTPLTKEAKV